MLKSDYTKPGTDNEWTNSMNFFGINDSVTFRDLFRVTGTLDTGKLSNTFTRQLPQRLHRRVGHSFATPAPTRTKPIRLEVPAYVTLDWQGRYIVSKAITLRAGIKNILNEDPPLSLRASSGHQVGFDPRFADPLGRQAYITGNYKF